MKGKCGRAEEWMGCGWVEWMGGKIGRQTVNGWMDR